MAVLGETDRSGLWADFMAELSAERNVMSGITKADLREPSPYNTYINKGLPPTAIGSPSMDSLMAAADPIANKYLFFLADHSGVTHYCKDFECQKDNKDTYF